MQLFPGSTGATEYLAHEEASDYILATQRTLRKLSVQTSCLTYLRANRVFVPKSTYDTRLFSSLLNTSHRVAIVSLVQEALASAGYTFTNLVPTWGDYSTTRALGHDFVLNEARQIMSCLEDEVTAWARCVEQVELKRRAQGQLGGVSDGVVLSDIPETGSPKEVEGVPSLTSSGFQTPTRQIVRGLNFDDVSADSDEDMPTVQSKLPVQGPSRPLKSVVQAQGLPREPKASVTHAATVSDPPRGRRSSTPATLEAPRRARRDANTSSDSDSESSSGDSSFSNNSYRRGSRGSTKKRRSRKSRGSRRARERDDDAGSEVRGVYVIPADAIKVFNPENKWSLEERRAWWELYLYLAREGCWSDRKCAQNLKRILVRPHRSWFEQIKTPVRENWRELKATFEQEFCKSKTNASALYYDKKQGRNHTAREFLWEMNRAARRARIPHSKGEDLMEHLERFILGLRNPTRYQMLLTTGKFETIEDFEQLLERDERFPGERQGRDRDTSSARERDKSYPRDRDRRGYDSDPDRDRDRSASRERDRARSYDRRDRSESRERDSYQDRDRAQGRDRQREPERGDDGSRGRERQREPERGDDGGRGRRGPTDPRAYRIEKGMTPRSTPQVRFAESDYQGYAYDHEDEYEDLYQAVAAPSTQERQPPDASRPGFSNGGYPPRNQFQGGNSQYSGGFQRQQFGGGYQQQQQSFRRPGFGNGYPGSPRGSVRCPDCGNYGHSSGNCSPCPACGKIHFRGQCDWSGSFLELKRMIEAVQAKVKDFPQSPGGNMSVDVQGNGKSKDIQSSN